MKYNRLTLEFKQEDKNLEVSFPDYDFWHSLLIYRIALLLGIALYAVFVLRMAAAVPLNNNFFLISANIIGMVVCYYSEFFGSIYLALTLWLC